MYYKGKKEKKEEALDRLVNGLKRSLEAVENDEKARKGDNSPIALKIAKVVAVAAVITVVSAALTHAAGVIAQEIAGGGSVDGDVLGAVAQAAGEGLKNLADPEQTNKKTNNNFLKLSDFYYLNLPKFSVRIIICQSL